MEKRRPEDAGRRILISGPDIEIKLAKRCDLENKNQRIRKIKQ